MAFGEERQHGQGAGPAPARGQEPGGIPGIDRIIGKVMRRHRQAAGATQKDVARMLGVSFQQLQKYETGVNRLALARLLDFCLALGLRPEQVVAEILRDTTAVPVAVEAMRNDAGRG